MMSCFYHDVAGPRRLWLRRPSSIRLRRLVLAPAPRRRRNLAWTTASGGAVSVASLHRQETVELPRWLRRWTVALVLPLAWRGMMPVAGAPGPMGRPALPDPGERARERTCEGRSRQPSLWPASGCCSRASRVTSWHGATEVSTRASADKYAADLLPLLDRFT